MPPKRKPLSEDQKRQLEYYGGLNMSLFKCGQLIGGPSDRKLREEMLKDSSVREAYERGRAKVGGQARHTLLEMALGVKNKDKDKEKKPWKIEPDFRALKLWCETQEDFKTTSLVEVSGINGKPIESTTVLSKDQIRARLKRLRQINKLTDDDGDD